MCHNGFWHKMTLPILNIDIFLFRSGRVIHPENKFVLRSFKSSFPVKLNGRYVRAVASLFKIIFVQNTLSKWTGYLPKMKHKRIRRGSKNMEICSPFNGASSCQCGINFHCQFWGVGAILNRKASATCVLWWEINNPSNVNPLFFQVSLHIRANIVPHVEDKRGVKCIFISCYMFYLPILILGSIAFVKFPYFWSQNCFLNRTNKLYPAEWTLIV